MNEERDSAEATAATIPLNLTVVDEIVQTKATCPFLGAAVKTGKLPIRDEPDNPLASIEDLRRLGNLGGGDLGELLAFFAAGNHAFMRGISGRLDQSVPQGMFSLELPGSQGSHPGHSGILQGDPETLESGRFSPADFARLLSLARDGFIKRSDVGRFIAGNLRRDPKAKVFGTSAVLLLARDLGHFATSAGPALVSKLVGPNESSEKDHRELEERLTKLLGEDNLVGSAGEFGLLFAFFANKPGVQQVDGEPALAIDDLRTMFVDKQLPNGWENWPKTRLDWVRNTTSLMVSAAKEYLALESIAS